MKRFVVGLLLVGMLLSSNTVGINSKAPVTVKPSDNPQNSLTWAGKYEGSIPGADSEIKTAITLSSDLTYTMTYQYVDKDSAVYTDKGTFQWDATGEMVTLSGTDIPNQYKVGEGRLTQLDMDGKPIAGQFADKYILKQTSKTADVTDSSQNSLTWAGKYEGSIPGADSEIKTAITLSSDLTYTMTYQYVDKDSTVYTDKGTFRWDATGEIVTLSGTDMPNQYKVGEGRLTQLDVDGKPIAGQFADKYILKQTAGGK
ncbi:MAG: copper resistance protein NlpE [Firmicutes bacterium]|nr:copper resistance protein NlpE [Bacillota bacterium]